MPSRNKFCSPKCATAARQQYDKIIAPKDGYAEDVRRLQPKHPQGWEPHVEQVGNKATAISQPLGVENADEEMLIRGWKLDPNEWRIDGPVNCRKWQALTPVQAIHETDEGTEREAARWWIPPSGGDCQCDPVNPNFHYEQRWLYYYKANLVRRTTAVAEGTDYADLVEEIRSFEPHTPGRLYGDRGFVVVLSDLQIGKSDGDGTFGTSTRVLERLRSVEKRIEDLRSIGHEIDTLYIISLGDMIENCDGYYAQQTFRADLNRRDQVNLLRRLILKAIERWSPLFDRVVVACVGGNHGENRKEGKSFTDFADNDDVAVFDQIEDVLSANPERFGHVSFKIPKDNLAMTLDVYGVIVGLAHGHQAGKGANPIQRLTNWWKDQALGMQPVGDAKLLFTGHYHHFSLVNLGERTHIQAPALDGGSDWWRNATGMHAHPGILTLMVGESCGPSGYTGLEVL